MSCRCSCESNPCQLCGAGEYSDGYFGREDGYIQMDMRFQVHVVAAHVFRKSSALLNPIASLVLLLCSHLIILHDFNVCLRVI